MVKIDSVKKKPSWAKSLFTDIPVLKNHPWIHHLDGLSKEVYECDRTIIRFSKDQIELHQEIELLSQLDLTPFRIPQYKKKINIPEGMVGFYPKIEGKRLETEKYKILTNEQKQLIHFDLAQFLNIFHGSKITSKTYQELKDKGDHFYPSFKSYFLDVFKGKLSTEEVAAFVDIINKIESYNKSCIPTLIHGDFTSDHWFFNNENRLVGCIDFEDAMIFDPAYDMAGIMMSYGEMATLDVVNHYEFPLDEHWMDRVNLYVMLVPYHQKLHDYLTKNE